MIFFLVLFKFMVDNWQVISITFGEKKIVDMIGNNKLLGNGFSE